jgi:hypothetical protein
MVHGSRRTGGKCMPENPALGLPGVIQGSRARNHLVCASREAEKLQREHTGQGGTYLLMLAGWLGRIDIKSCMTVEQSTH